MRRYHKILDQLVKFSGVDLETGEFYEMDGQLRNIMGKMIDHAEEAGCIEFEIIVRAKGSK